MLVTDTAHYHMLSHPVPKPSRLISSMSVEITAVRLHSKYDEAQLAFLPCV